MSLYSVAAELTGTKLGQCKRFSRAWASKRVCALRSAPLGFVVVYPCRVQVAAGPAHGTECVCLGDVWG